MSERFRDRVDAGRQLAARLGAYAGRPDVLVLGLPRGGVVVAAEVARALGAPLDVIVVRKLGVPGQEELAMGAIASGGIRILNRDVVQPLHITSGEIDAVAGRERGELERRERSYRDDRPPPAIQGRTILLVDDGIATGATVYAAIAAVRQQQPARIVVAVPVAAPSTCRDLLSVADEVVCVIMPESFFAVGSWYEDFSATTDEQVRAALAGYE
ncbi:MAG TPA: phosphoribosyltransferase [Chloroflexota bacterium]|nr:phosphoribosyltransferase [Chloroflexota bacterium]